MSTDHNGGLAFPHYSEDGMTLRDYAAIKFAAAWVVGLSGQPMVESREQQLREANRLGLLQADDFLKARKP